jgi:hypothetical protein
MTFMFIKHSRAALIGLLALCVPTSGDAQDDAMTFRVAVARNCRDSCAAEIAANGMIGLDSADAFRAIATTLAPSPIVVRLASPGGNLVASLQLGQAFREFNTTLIVDHGRRCVSACVYAFLGGTVRRVMGGQIGVHRFRPESQESDHDFPPVLVQRTTQILTEYAASMQVDPELIALAMSVSPPAVHFLDAGERRRYRVTN